MKDEAGQLEQDVNRQFALFERDLPNLLPSHLGEWVVFLDSARQFTATERDAVEWAYANLRDEDPFVVAEVRKIEAHPITAAMAFLMGVSPA